MFKKTKGGMRMRGGGPVRKKAKGMKRGGPVKRAKGYKRGGPVKSKGRKRGGKKRK